MKLNGFVEAVARPEGVGGGLRSVDDIRTVLRAGADKARVEGTFTLNAAARESINPVLDEIGIEHEDENLIVTREISREGRNVCRVNGRTVTLHALQRIGEFVSRLVALCSCF